MYKKLKTIFTWKNMKKTITEYVNKCKQCNMNKHGIKTREIFEHTTTPTKPFDCISIDTIGPFMKSNLGNRYAITIQCDLSKYVILKPIPDKQAATLAKALVENLILVYGIPLLIKTDQGTEYKNETFTKISNLLQIKHNFSTAYHPQTIGSLERNHRCLNEYVRQFVNQSLTDCVTVPTAEIKD